MADRHVLIAGTGRAGTSSLVRLLTRCGVDTGYLGDEAYNPQIRAGCERFAVVPETLEQWARLPYVVKSPYLSARIADLVALGVQIDAVIVPVRELGEVHRSRVDNRVVWTGGTTRDNMARVLGEAISQTMAARLPLIMLDFRKMTGPDGGKYLGERLAWLFALDPARMAERWAELFPINEGGKHEEVGGDLSDVPSA